MPLGWSREAVAKPFRDGTHRAVSPESTLARAAPAAAAAGITRVGMATGLDVLGIPVAAAYRPNSRTVAVHQSKGVSVAAAKASAVMEAIETFHAETADLPVRLSSFAQLRREVRALDPATLPRTGADSIDDARLLWTPGVRLADGAAVWVPHELVGIDLAPDSRWPGAGLFQATTNGLASGNHRLEAATHALCEVVERDAVALWQAMPLAAQDARALDLATVDDPTARAWQARIAAAGQALQVWDATSDLGLPVFICLLAGDDDVQPELGFGCHVDRTVALLRAIGEAAQARLTVISGARDDLTPAGYGEAAVRRRQDAAGAWLARRGTRDYHAAPTVACGDLASDLRAVLDRLDAAGYGDAALVDLTRPELGIPVVRVVVPGLEGPWAPAGNEYRPGLRARRMAMQ